MAKKKKPSPPKQAKKVSLARVPARVETMTDGLIKRNALELTLDGLMEGLQAFRSFSTGEGGSQTEPDYATRLKTQQLILEHLVGCPPKRTQVIHGVMPTAPMDREQTRDAIAQKLSLLISRPDVTVSELLAAQRGLEETEKDSAAKPLNEEELIAAARRVHGMGGEADTSITREDELKALDQKIESFMEARKALAGSLDAK